MTTTRATEVQNESKTVRESCTAATVTVSVVSAVVTALLVMVISVAVHIAVYQCFYKPRLMRSSPVVQDVNEREEPVLEMRQNKAYELVKPH